jgi:hypothetical protein
VPDVRLPDRLGREYLPGREQPGRAMKARSRKRVAFARRHRSKAMTISERGAAPRSGVSIAKRMGQILGARNRTFRDAANVRLNTREHARLQARAAGRV